MTTSAKIPAGWYPDPEQPGSERLYDGVKWTESRRPPRGKFAAKHANVTAAVVLLVIGILVMLGIPGAIASLARGTGVAGAIVGLIFCLVVGGGLAAWAIYFFRGKGENPAVAAQRAQVQLAAEQYFHQTVEYLARVNTGAAGLVALRNVDDAANRAFGAAGPQISADAVAAIGVDRASFSSERIGNLAVRGAGVWLEIFRDWVILGQEAHDVDEHTRISVFLDGSIQVVPRQVQKGNKVVTVNEQHDMRTAEVQVASDGWSVSAPINPNDVPEARRIADQLTAHIARLRPAAVTSADIRAMVETILNNSGQPPAEKLKQIANLRFDRLLSDAEFQQAKERILGIGAHFED